MFFVSDAMAAGEAAAQVGGMEGFLMQVVPLVVIFAVFWFFLIRPQQKRQKEHMQMCEGLPRGDEVTTLGGISVVIRMQRTSGSVVLPKGTLKI